MRICVISLSSSRKAGGLFYSVRHLSEVISEQPGVKLSVIATEDDFTKADLSAWNKLDLKTFKRTSKVKFGFSIDMLFFLLKNDFDLIHLHGIWNFASLAVFINYKIKKTPYVVSPRGMLDQWIFKNNRLLKKVFWALYEKSVIKNATFVHALSNSEFKTVSDLDVAKNIVLSPNGVAGVVPVDRCWTKPQKKMVFIGRIDKKKGLLELVEAWSKISDHKGWSLEIYGWGDEKYLEQVNTSIESSTVSSVTFHGECYGEEKHNCLVNADAFILPSYSEGLPMAVLEAWAYGVPSLLTAECNLPDGFEHGAAEEINLGPALSIALEKFLSKSPDDLHSMSIAAQNLIEAKYLWSRIGSNMKQHYTKFITEK
ncbi:glycosyltransferase [Pseudomonas sp.]|uniref:glycosyltransferase n=1 Tax=Pseudomonas sp. TaxID=306 RepID=UPI000E8F8BC1|nr:glycosyltransferase [Pseudomonas sp.]HBP47459.1 hypothetical protein [Pseudomonas sp.]